MDNIEIKTALLTGSSPGLKESSRDEHLVLNIQESITKNQTDYGNTESEKSPRKIIQVDLTKLGSPIEE